MLRELKGYKCPGCGAMLEPADSDKEKGVLICRYCNARLQLEIDKEKQTYGTHHGDATENQRRKARIVTAVAGGVLLLIGITAAVILSPGKRPHRKTTESAQTPVPKDAVIITEDALSDYPIYCNGDDSIYIRNESFRKKEKILAAAGKCRAMIDNSTLVSDSYAITTSSTGTITIENTDITSELTALLATGNARVAINNSRITGKKVAVHAAGNALVTVTNCTMSAPIAAETLLKGRIVISNSNIHGVTRGNVEKD